jgi:prepilin-type processing-associated H-X9-DG protein
MHRHGLSRVEWVAMILMALVLAAILLPALLQNRQSSRRTMCDARLTDLGMTTLFVAELRPGKHFLGYANEQAIDAAGTRVKTGWQFDLLPFLARGVEVNLDEVPSGERFNPLKFLPGADVFGPRQEFYAKYGPFGPKETRGNIPEAYIPEFMCPEDPRSRVDKRQRWTSYVANCGMPDGKPSGKIPPDWPANGVFLSEFDNRDPAIFTSPQFVDDHDGASFTMMLSENLDAGLWTDSDEARVGFLWAPGDAAGNHTPECAVLFINQERGTGDGSARYARPSSEHPGGAMVMYCDGRTKFIDQRLAFRIYCAQMTPDGQNAKQPGSDKLLEPPYREVRK